MKIYPSIIKQYGSKNIFRIDDFKEYFYKGLRYNTDYLCYKLFDNILIINGDNEVHIDDADWLSRYLDEVEKSPIEFYSDIFLFFVNKIDSLEKEIEYLERTIADD